MFNPSAVKALLPFANPIRAQSFRPHTSIPSFILPLNIHLSSSAHHTLSRSASLQLQPSPEGPVPASAPTHVRVFTAPPTAKPLTTEAKSSDLPHPSRQPYVSSGAYTS
ncbi:hypothetical protein M011DRAFT_468102 [Sporormia fimetaria CBS 119925]|uniref:Uncharacterized protein n=1 Tax=Sporormia fimetaria CBS 119925 TaxID=1340428 RepID=A0A6A6VC46_9PLEO|nr:hypothetical protein M011DRAFT_468102 [Sporormia fimetaria CBS 119925]